MNRLDINLSPTASGSQEVTLPNDTFKYVAVQNDTTYTITIYRGTQVDISKRVLYAPPGSLVSVPLPEIDQNVQPAYLIVYNGSGSTNIRIFFSQENIINNQSLNINGLATAAQFPAALTGSGNFMVSIEEPLETLTGAVKVIDNDHAYIHQGKGFSLSRKTTLSAGTSAYIHLVTSADKWVHLRPALISTDADKVDVILYEAPTTSADGTALVCLNRDRSSLVASETSVYHSPVVTADGTQLEDIYLGGGTGTGGNRSGSQTGGPLEWILKKSTHYVYKIMNNGTGTVNVGLDLFWYEE